MPKEVLFNPPSFSLQDAIHDSIQHHIDSIPEDKIGGIFGVVTKDGNGEVITNAVVAIRRKDRLEVTGYVGKRWGKELVGGGEVKFFF